MNVTARFALALLVLYPALTHAQGVLFNFYDGSSLAYPLLEIRSVKPLPTEMQASLWNNSPITAVRSLEPSAVTTFVPDVPLPSTMSLNVFPNPAIGEANIAIQVDAPEWVSVELFDGMGNLVRTLHSGRMVAGRHQLKWDGRDEGARTVAAGIYQCRVVRRTGSSSMKIVLQH